MICHVMDKRSQYNIHLKAKQTYLKNYSALNTGNTINIRIFICASRRAKLQ